MSILINSHDAILNLGVKGPSGGRVSGLSLSLKGDRSNRIENKIGDVGDG